MRPKRIEEHGDKIKYKIKKPGLIKVESPNNFLIFFALFHLLSLRIEVNNRIPKAMGTIQKAN